MYYSKLITFIMHFVINLNCGYFHMSVECTVCRQKYGVTQSAVAKASDDIITHDIHVLYCSMGLCNVV